MATTGIQSLGGGLNGEAIQSSSNRQLDMNSFLTMFTTQLKYQDPTNPLESYELAAQLAQFSTVEKLTQINSNILQAQSYLSSIANAQMMGVLGKEVVGQDDSLKLQGGQSSSGFFQVDIPAAVTIKILDQEGRLVRTQDLGLQQPGQHEVSWDGRNDAGQTMPDATYHFVIEASDAMGNPVETSRTIRGEVYAFRTEAGVPYLILGGAEGVRLPVSAVMEVREAAQT